ESVITRRYHSRWGGARVESCASRRRHRTCFGRGGCSGAKRCVKSWVVGAINPLRPSDCLLQFRSPRLFSFKFGSPGEQKTRSLGWVACARGPHLYRYRVAQFCANNLEEIIYCRGEIGIREAVGRQASSGEGRRSAKDGSVRERAQEDAVFGPT